MAVCCSREEEEGREWRGEEVKGKKEKETQKEKGGKTTFQLSFNTDSVQKSR